jgi:hypothetical protein
MINMYECDFIRFSSGRKAYANNGIVGIDADLDTFGGHDNGLPVPTTEIDVYDGMEPEYIFTKEDAIELADMMIARWQAYKTLHIG